MAPRDTDKPVIVQSDRTILLEADSPVYEDARDCLSRFAELVKSPEHIHTYRITPLSLWNAAAAGMTTSEILEGLERFSRYEIPQNLYVDIRDILSRWGRIRLRRDDDPSRLVLECDDPLLVAELLRHRMLTPYLVGHENRRRLFIRPEDRGNVKSALIRIGFPVEDLAGYAPGAPLDIELRAVTRAGKPFRLRAYQQAAADTFHAGGSEWGGSGVIVLPCGAGKTIVALAAMARTRVKTLVLTTNTVALRQWREELLDKTTLQPEDIGEYSGEEKTVRPVTIASYQILVYRKAKKGPFIHFDIFDREDWGLIIYDEVHLLPAPVFRATASLQARRRLGLTATLVREDGLEEEVFSLIGPKKYDVPWKLLEKQGWIATAACVEVRVSMPSDERYRYAVAAPRDKYAIAAMNPAKYTVCRELVERHRQDNVLIIGQYLEQLDVLAGMFNAPLITGKTPVSERERLYRAFREGAVKLLVVSKVANFAIDLPDANVAIQVSGTFGSRQEEAQRLGRILRPKADGSLARFYSLVTRDTCDQDFSVKRQLFLVEQGYHYEIIDDEHL